MFGKMHRLLSWTRQDQDLDEEIQAHLAIEVQQRIEAGETPEQAASSAQNSFGNVVLIKEVTREMWGWRSLETLLQDAVYACRMLRKTPALTIIAVLTLALGIGANSAVFSIVHAVLLNPLPYKDPGRLAIINRTDSQPNGDHYGQTSFRDFQEWKSQSHSFASMTVFYIQGWSRMTLTGVPEPEKVQGAHVDADFFPTIGISPAIGRPIEADDVRTSRKVVLISDGLARRRFGEPGAAIGNNVEIEGRNWQIVGVMPRQFEFPYEDVQFWAPITSHPDWIDKVETDPFDKLRWKVLGRVKADVSLERARVEMKALGAHMAEEHPATHKTLGINVIPLQEQIAGNMRTPLMILLCAVALVLLIACANVANLFTARGAVRSREFAIRAALGAGRIRIARQLLTEALAIGFLAGSAGLLIAVPAIRLLKRTAPQNIPRLSEAGLSVPVLLFTLIICLLAVTIFGLLPAWRIVRSDPNDSLKDGSRSGTGSQRNRRVHGWLVAAQFAMALILLSGAGLLIRSLVAVISTDPGFRPEQTLAIKLQLPNGTPEPQLVTLYSQVVSRLKAIPGIQAAGAASNLFFLDERRTHSLRQVEGRAPERLETWTPLVWTQVTGEYFQAMGIGLLQGRYFNEQDRPDTAPVVIVNETLARRFWPGVNPVGKRLRGFDPRGRNDEWVTVVGTVRDTRSFGIEKHAISQIYEVQSQRGDTTPNFVIRTSADPMKLAGPVRDALRGVSKTAILSGVSTMGEQLREQTAQRRFETWILTVFSALALALAGIGIFGVMQYSVSQRTQELGLRMALGAHPFELMSMVLRQGVRLAAIGMSAGALGSIVVARSISGLLYDVRPFDPVTFGCVSGLLLAVALLACYIPARRATAISPTVALRYE